MGHKKENHITIDIPYIFRNLRRYALVILFCACIAGVISYIALDMYMQPTYRGHISLAVVPRDNYQDRLWEEYVSSAMTRSANALNSEALKEQIAKIEGMEDINADMYVVDVANTNLIYMTSTSDTAEGAFRMLKAALETYPQISTYFESNYLIKTLVAPSATSIGRANPPTMKYAMWVALAAIVLGCGIVFLSCLFSEKIHNEEQAARVLDLDLLGSVHYIKKKRAQKALLVSSDMTDGSFTEEMDKIVTRLQKRMDAQNYKVLMVGGINENDGKSTVTANVALMLAKRGKRVLLIDMDLRRPALAKIFDKDVEKGKEFTDYLNGCSPFKQVLDASRKQSGIYHVWQKNPIPDPDKILEKGVIKKLLDVSGDFVDYVVIDTPPLGIVRDPEIIAGYADAGVLVLRQDMVRAAEVNDAVDMLEEAGATVVGGVLNMVKGDASFQGRKSQYERYYYGYKK